MRVARRKVALTKFVNVWMVDPRAEQHFGWDHGVLVRQKKLAIEHAPLVWSIWWARYLHIEVAIVVLRRLHIDSHN